MKKSVNTSYLATMFVPRVYHQNCRTINNNTITVLLLKYCELATISHRPTQTKHVSVSLKDPESIIKTSYIFSTFTFLYTKVACTVCFMSPQSAVQNECLAREICLWERGFPTKVETTNCRGFGSLCLQWMHYKELDQRNTPCWSQIFSLEMWLVIYF